MAFAFSALEKMSDERTINQNQYVEALTDIMLALDISDEEYMRSLEGKWELSVDKNVN